MCPKFACNVCCVKANLNAGMQRQLLHSARVIMAWRLWTCQQVCQSNIIVHFTVRHNIDFKVYQSRLNSTKWYCDGTAKRPCSPNISAWRILNWILLSKYKCLDTKVSFVCFKRLMEAQDRVWRILEGVISQPLRRLECELLNQERDMAVMGHALYKSR